MFIKMAKKNIPQEIKNVKNYNLYCSHSKLVNKYQSRHDTALSNKFATGLQVANFINSKPNGRL